MKIPDPPHNNDMKAIGRVASELRLLENRVQNLEDGITLLCANNLSASNTKSVTAMQELDILLQSITSLAVYMEALASDVQHGGVIHSKTALNSMPLRDMADRLSGRNPKVPPNKSPELF